MAATTTNNKSSKQNKSRAKQVAERYGVREQPSVTMR